MGSYRQGVLLLEIYLILHFKKKEKSTIDPTRKSHHVVQRSTKCPSAPSPPHLTTEEREAPLLHYFQEARTMVPEAID